MTATTSTTENGRPRGGLDELLEHACAVKAVFTDLDGTFLTPDSTVPPRSGEVIDRLQATGVRFVPTSGRTLAAVRSLFGADLFARIDTVAGNGMDVVAGGELARHLVYRPHDLERLLEAVQQSPLRLGVVLFDEGGPYVTGGEADFARSYSRSLEHAPETPLAQGLRRGAVLKAAIVARDGSQEACAALEPLLGDAFTLARCGDHWIDVLMKGVDKADGIRCVLEYIGAEPCEALCFGDSMNDLGMIGALPHSVAVANAMPAVKRLCVYEIGSNAECAVLSCLERIAELRERAL